jgi:hypothetical protein
VYATLVRVTWPETTITLHNKSSPALHSSHNLFQKPKKDIHKAQTQSTPQITKENNRNNPPGMMKKSNLVSAQNPNPTLIEA